MVKELIIILIKSSIQSMQIEALTVSYRFVKQLRTKFGEALYLSGSISSLGNWEPKKSLKMMLYGEDYWVIEVLIPVNVQLEFKYLIGQFEHFEGVAKAWIGQKNQTLKIGPEKIGYFSQENNSDLKIMSFNVRFENAKDKEIYSWEKRKENCADTISEFFPDIVGVQEPRSSQRMYIFQKIKQFYNYYGKPRDLLEDEQSGVFIRKDKFRVIQQGYIWINEQKKEGKKGFGARLPRYFTYLVIVPFTKKGWSVVFNTHLDHEKKTAREYGIRYIAQTIQSLALKYKQLRNYFITGDFNTSDDDQIFNHFQKINIKSMRQVLPLDRSDHGATFNGFSKIIKVIDKTLKYFNLDAGASIDHIFYKAQEYEAKYFKCIRYEEKIVSDHYPIVGLFNLIS